MLTSCKRSAHHGYTNYENNLMMTLDCLHFHPEIDIVEIDFVYHHHDFLSSHDYSEENLKNASSLEEWVDHFIKLKKILWIDLKDVPSSIFFPSLSKLNINQLILKLNRLSLIYPLLNNYIMISCQFSHIYERLKMFNKHFMIMQDCPMDYYYILNYFTSLFNVNIIKTIDNPIIAIDKNFVQLDDFIEKSSAKTIIIYNYEIGDSIPISNKKHLIYQYNYKK